MKEYGFGLDLGGTTCKAGLFKTDGTLVEKWEIPTDTSNNGANIIGNLAKAVKEKMAEKDISADQIWGVGIGAPGPVTPDGVVNKCANLGWGVTPLEKELSELLDGIAVKAGNDANVAALGEAWMGAGRDCSSIVMVTLGTGVGGGVIIDDKIVPGATGAGGEIGHITVNKNETLTCGCGRKGCLEQYASATGIARTARIHLAAEPNRETSLREIENLETRHVFDAAKAGDAMAIEVVDETMKILAEALSVIACVVNPDAFVIGGGVSKAGQYLIDSIEKYFKEDAFHACKDTKIVLATLGNDAGIYGSVKMILD